VNARRRRSLLTALALGGLSSCQLLVRATLKEHSDGGPINFVAPQDALEVGAALPDGGEAPVDGMAKVACRPEPVDPSKCPPHAEGDCVPTCCARPVSQPPELWGTLDRVRARWLPQPGSASFPLAINDGYVKGSSSASRGATYQQCLDLARGGLIRFQARFPPAGASPDERVSILLTQADHLTPPLFPHLLHINLTADGFVEVGQGAQNSRKIFVGPGDARFSVDLVPVADLGADWLVMRIEVEQGGSTPTRIYDRKAVAGTDLVRSTECRTGGLFLSVVGAGTTSSLALGALEMSSASCANPAALEELPTALRPADFSMLNGRIAAPAVLRLPAVGPAGSVRWEMLLEGSNRQPGEQVKSSERVGILRAFADEAVPLWKPKPDPYLVCPSQDCTEPAYRGPSLTVRPGDNRIFAAHAFRPPEDPEVSQIVLRAVERTAALDFEPPLSVLQAGRDVPECQAIDDPALVPRLPNPHNEADEGGFFLFFTCTGERGRSLRLAAYSAGLTRRERPDGWGSNGFRSVLSEDDVARYHAANVQHMYGPEVLLRMGEGGRSGVRPLEYRLWFLTDGGDVQLATAITTTADPFVLRFSTYVANPVLTSSRLPNCGMGCTIVAIAPTFLDDAEHEILLLVGTDNEASDRTFSEIRSFRQWWELPP
jgi:hypothetical protein